MLSRVGASAVRGGAAQLRRQPRQPLASLAPQRPQRACGQSQHVDARRPLQSTRVVRAAAGDKDKTWGEIFKGAGELARDVVNKVKDSVGSALQRKPSDHNGEREGDGAGAGTGRRAPSQRQQQRDRAAPLAPGMPPFGEGGGLMGRAVGGMLGMAVNALGAQMEKAAAESRSAYDEAAAAVEASAKLRERMGGQVTAGPVMSQSVGSSSINGVETKSVSLLFQVRSSSGASGTARVSAREAPRSPRALDVSVQLPDGSVVPIDTRGGGGSAAGATIDVDYTEVR